MADITKTVYYKGYKVEASTITDFYNRLNTLITDDNNTGTKTTLTVPNLSNTVITTA